MFELNLTPSLKKDLSITLKEKAQRLVKIKGFSKIYLICWGILAIPVTKDIIKFSNYLENHSILSSITGASITNSKIAFYMIFLVAFLLWYSSISPFSKQRKSLIKAINVDFCSHKASCTCKEDFIVQMRQNHNIDLIFDE